MNLTPDQRLHVAILEREVRNDGHRLTRAEAALVFDALAEMTADLEERQACIVNIATCSACELCQETARRSLIVDARVWAEAEGDADSIKEDDAP